MKKDIVLRIGHILKKVEDNEEFAVGIRLTGSKTIQWTDFTNSQWDTIFILETGKIQRTDQLKIVLYKKSKCGCKNRIYTNIIHLEEPDEIHRILLKVDFDGVNSHVYPQRQKIKVATLSLHDKLSQQPPPSIHEISVSGYLQKAKKSCKKIFKTLSRYMTYNDFPKSQFNYTLHKLSSFKVDRAQSQYRYTRLGIYHASVEASNGHHEIFQFKAELAASEKEKIQLQEGTKSKKELAEYLKDIDDLKSQTQDARSQLSLANIKIREMNEKMKKYELEIINHKKKSRDLPVTDIEIGAYEYGGINPAMIAEHWNDMYSGLYRTIVRAIKSVKSPSHTHINTLDSNEHWNMVYRNSKKKITQPRFQAYTVVRKTSELLRLTGRAVVINKDGSIAEDNKKDFLLDLMTQTQTQTHSRQEIAKTLLDKLVNPNDLTHKTTGSFFDKLSSPLKEYLDEIFKINLHRLKEIVKYYSIGDNDVYNSLEIFLYTAIYIAIEISAISDNSIVAYWSSCYWDKELFKIQTDNHSLQIPLMENFYNEIERIPLSEDQAPFILFSVFPGCAYFDGTDQIEIISPCKVIYTGSD